MVDLASTEKEIFAHHRLKPTDLGMLPFSLSFFPKLYLWGCRPKYILGHEPCPRRHNGPRID